MADLIKLDPSNMVKTEQKIKLKVNLEIIAAGKEITDQWKSHTFVYVPEEDHNLAESGTAFTVSGPPVFTRMLLYDAVSPRGFHYGARQHDDDSLFHFGSQKKFIKPMATSRFLTKGMHEVNEMAIINKHVQFALK